MTLTEFKGSRSRTSPPDNLAPAVAALWWVAKDDWDKAHTIVMDEPGKDCAWVHAYLHRVEGDLGNAGYWYKQAGKNASSGSFETEWAAIAGELLAGTASR